jgi:hypothetical protein
MQRKKARDEESPVRVERAGFLFRGERSPRGSEIPRWGIERVTNPLPFFSVNVSEQNPYLNFMKLANLTRE